MVQSKCWLLSIALLLWRCIGPWRKLRSDLFLVAVGRQALPEHSRLPQRHVVSLLSRFPDPYLPVICPQGVSPEGCKCLRNYKVYRKIQWLIGGTFRSHDSEWMHTNVFFLCALLFFPHQQQEQKFTGEVEDPCENPPPFLLLLPTGSSKPTSEHVLPVYG